MTTTLVGAVSAGVNDDSMCGVKKTSNATENHTNNGQQNERTKNDLFIPDGLCGDGGFRPPEKETKQSELSDISFASQRLCFL